MRAVWLRSGEVLDTMRRGGRRVLFEARGGGALFAQLVAAHEAGGRLFGIKGSLRPKAARVNQRDALRGASVALCDYARVQAMACPDCPGSDAVAARLLAPLDAVAPARKGGRSGKTSAKAAEDAKMLTPRAAKEVSPDAPIVPSAQPANDAAPAGHRDLTAPPRPPTPRWGILRSPAQDLRRHDARPSHAPVGTRSRGDAAADAAADAAESRGCTGLWLVAASPRLPRPHRRIGSAARRVGVNMSARWETGYAPSGEAY